MLKVLPGMRVLDIGCGTGYMTLACAMLGASYAEGWDIEGPVVHFAREVGVQSKLPCTFRVFNGFSAPPAGDIGTFDRVHVGAGLEGKDVPHFVRLLKVGGILVAPVDDRMVAITKR
jgi:protein-L-isoaspartate O-methyltransferase